MKIKILLMMFLSLALSACGGSDELKKVENYLKTVQQQPKPPVEPLPVLASVPKEQYNAENLRSPFEPPQKPVVSNAFSPDINRQKEELEAYPLDALHMVGILKQGQEQWALITDPNGKVYRATIGSHLGQNYGRIIQIENDKIILLETLPDGLGGWKQQQTTLAVANPGATP